MAKFALLMRIDCKSLYLEANGKEAKLGHYYERYDLKAALVGFETLVSSHKMCVDNPRHRRRLFIKLQHT